jgi:hypothetical protein
MSTLQRHSLTRARRATINEALPNHLLPRCEPPTRPHCHFLLHNKRLNTLHNSCASAMHYVHSHAHISTNSRSSALRISPSMATQTSRSEPPLSNPDPLSFANNFRTYCKCTDNFFGFIRALTKMKKFHNFLCETPPFLVSERVKRISVNLIAKTDAWNERLRVV